MNTELERLKIQKTQMYLQVVSVIISGVLLYVLVSNKKASNVIENDLVDIEED